MGAEIAGRPARSRVGVGDRIPHRVDRQRGRHLEFCRLFEFGHRAPVLRSADLAVQNAESLGLPRLGFLHRLVGIARTVETEVGQGIRAPHGAKMVVELGVLQPTAAWRRVESSPAPARSARPRRQSGPERLQSSCAATEYGAGASGFPSSRQCRSACSQHSSARFQRAGPQPDEAQVHPAAGDVVRPGVSSDDGIGLGYQLLGRRVVAHRPARRGALQLCSGVRQFPSVGPAPWLPRGAARVRLRSAARSRRRICRMRWPRRSGDGRRTRCHLPRLSMPSITCSHNGTDRTCRSSSHSAVAHRIWAWMRRYACSSARSGKSPSASVSLNSVSAAAAPS